MSGLWKRALNKGIRVFRGLEKAGSHGEADPYRRWIENVSPDISLSPGRIEAMAVRPFFSIIMPTYNSVPLFFEELVTAICSQTYTHFEVCISDDNSTDEAFVALLRRLPERDPRFRVIFSTENRGIAGNTNRALDAARGEFMVLCDHDDMIAPFALESIALHINEHPRVDLMYSDEDMLTQEGFRHSPRLQPDWNPDMMTSHMYCPHMVSFRKTLCDKTGRMDPAMDGAQDYDYFLRLSEGARQIGHIPRILYSWRSAPTSVASDPSAKPYAYEAGRRALANAVKRRNEEAVVVKASGTGLGVYRIKRRVESPELTHIVEARGRDIVPVLRSIRTLADAPVEILVGMEEDRADIRELVEKEPWASCFTVPKGAGRARVYNRGAKMARSRSLFFSGHNVDLLDSEYPRAALEHTQRPEIGAVGVKIIYPNGNIYHTGMILGVNGFCGYAHRNIPQSAGYWNFALCIRNYSAVSWDLMAVSREKWESAGGFDESLTRFQDVDFCLRLGKKGFRHVYTPYIGGVLMRGVHAPEELRCEESARALVSRYGEEILNDPCFHSLHRKDLENFSI